MARIFPKDNNTRKIASRARQLVHSKINVEHWEFKEETGNDVGRDCILELSEDNQWRNHKVEGQIKGTTVPKYILEDKYISFSLEAKTLNYAINSNIPFILFVVDINKEIVYYQCIQDYYHENKREIDSKLGSGQESCSIRISIRSNLNFDDSYLQTIAKKNYNIYEEI